jgi:hypothetical protein
MLGVLFRPGASYLRLDYESMTYKKIETKGSFARRTAADWFGMTVDSKRNRLVGMQRPGNRLSPKGPGYKTITFIELDSNQVRTVTPANVKALGAGCKYVRETRYIPDDDIVLICDGILEQKKVRGKMAWVPGRKMAAWDPEKNRWLVLNIKNLPIGGRNRSMYGFNFGCRYDRKRRLLWGLDNYGHVCAMRLDVKKALGK